VVFQIRLGLRKVECPGSAVDDGSREGLARQRHGPLQGNANAGQGGGGGWVWQTGQVWFHGFDGKNSAGIFRQAGAGIIESGWTIQTRVTNWWRLASRGGGWAESRMGFIEARDFSGPGFRPSWRFDIINLAPINRPSPWAVIPIFSDRGGVCRSCCNEPPPDRSDSSSKRATRTTLLAVYLGNRGLDC
jgi:hypothetical protein